MNIFELASRKKLRFSLLGFTVATEDLWDLPLTTTKAQGLSLDKLAISVHSQIEAAPQVSFVNASAPNPELETNRLRLELLKAVIEAKKEANRVAQETAAKAERKRALLALLAEKETEEAKGKTREEILKELEEL